MTAPNPAELRAALDERIDETAGRWLDEALADIAAGVRAIGTLFPAAGRKCGRGPLVDNTTEPETLRTWSSEDAVRALLLTALPLTGAELGTELSALYRYGDAAEKRGVLRGAGVLREDPELVETGLPLVRDALRSNDTGLIAAGMAEFGARNLDPPAYRQGVLKCVFLGIPLRDVFGLPERLDAELARMLTDYARERSAAGREIPNDVWLVVDPTQHHSAEEA
ncbi:EboA domain-containing protein [Actinopolyspora sp. H202]|uniref:EboA domain-containing protein n=1 Tax=Actinopolyspora sp. H202 TaxID=1500456 RepID=UPI003EE5C26B